MHGMEFSHHTKRGISMGVGITSERPWLPVRVPYLNLPFLALAANGPGLAHRHIPMKQESRIQTKSEKHICPVSAVWTKIPLHRHGCLHVHPQGHLDKLRRYLSGHFASSSNHVDTG